MEKKINSFEKIDSFEKMDLTGDSKDDKKEEKYPYDNIVGSLYLGNIYSTKYYSKFDLVINCAYPENQVSKDNIKITKLPNIKNTTIVSLGIYDYSDQNIKQYFDMIATYISDCILNNKDILVHCRAGISRSTSFVLAFLLKYTNISLEENVKFVREKRSIINPNPGFIKQLKDYEKDLKTKYVLDFDKKS